MAGIDVFVCFGTGLAKRKGGNLPTLQKQHVKDAGRTGSGRRSGRVHHHLTGKRHMDAPGLPFGVRPVRGTIRASAFASTQFTGIADYLNGQHRDALQAFEQVRDPAGGFPDDVIDDGPCPGSGRGLDSGMERFDERRPVSSSPASTDSQSPVAECRS